MFWYYIAAAFCLLTSLQASPALAGQPSTSPSAIFSVIENDWMRLREGFSYGGTAYYRSLSLGITEKQSDGQKKLVRIEPRADTKEHSYNIQLTGRDGSYILHTKRDDGVVRNWHLTNQDLFEFDTATGVASTKKPRTPKNVNLSQIWVESFDPNTFKSRWLDYPWPAHERRRGATFQESWSSKAGLSVFTIKMSYPSAQGKINTLTRRFTFDRVDETTDRPVRIELLNDQGQLANEVRLKWKRVAMHGDYVAIPVQLDYRDFSRDPTSGALVPNSEKGYAIDVDSLADRPGAKTASQWDEVIKPRSVSAAVRNVEVGPSSLRWPLLLFFAFVISLAALLRLRAMRSVQR